jgi:hypothetical protein
MAFDLLPEEKVSLIDKLFDLKRRKRNLKKREQKRLDKEKKMMIEYL